jgi:4-hydroxy-3-methylbut-2-en-1-yl diphosphate reductase
MSRSAVREIQASGASVERGEVLVPTQIGDPVHGMLSCPAAPLVAGSLRARGRQVRIAELPRCDDSAGDADMTLHLVTCQRQDGSTAAIAAATAPGDALAAAAARAAVDEWAAVCATRTLLMAGSPWCSGALHAASAARQAASDYYGSGRNVHVLTPAAMPPETASALDELGAAITPSLTDVVAGDVVVFPAHGVTAAVRAEAARRGATVIDGTCPLVAAAQTAASRAADRGQQIVLISQPGQAATDAIINQAPGHVTVVETPAKTAAVQASDTRQITFLIQPGVVLETAAPIVSALRSRYPAVKPTVPAELCYAPSDRVGTIYSVALGSDLMLVLGDPNSPDAKQMCGHARDAGTRVQVVSDVDDIRPSMLAGVHTIGVAESTSARTGLAAHVLTALSGLGRLSVARRRLSTEKTSSVLT